MTVETPPLAPMVASSADSGIAEVLSDLNLFYIRQIGATLKKHVGLQDRLEREMKIRDGAIRLMSACTHETQLLEAAKTLHTSNSRTFAYMAELQKLKAAEVLEAVMDEPGFADNTRICKGRIALSDIRIPLVWREIFAHTKSKDNNKNAVFCLISNGFEVQDTELVCIDKTTTDISFNDVIVFENSSYDFKLKLDIFAHPMCGNSVSAATPQKLFSRLNRSIEKSEGKRVRERLKEDSSNGMKIGPQYEKIASLVLTLGDVSDVVRSHDLDRVPQTRLYLPLYESISCRLVAQPKCVTDILVSGFLHTMHMVGSIPNWQYMWCEVKGGVIRGWNNPEKSSKKPQFAIDLIPRDLKINEIEKMRQKRAHSFQIRDTTDRHIFAAGDKNELVKWIRGLRQHKSDFGAWSVACQSDVVDRNPMFIASPSPRKLPSELLFDRVVKKTLVYEQLSLESPLKAMTEIIKCTDLLNERSVDPKLVTSSVQSILLEKHTTAPWVELFTGNHGGQPAKVTRVTDIKSKETQESEARHHGYSLRPLMSRHSDSTVASTAARSHRSNHRINIPSCSEASGSDDAFLSESDDNCIKSPSGSKKKRRAPLPPKIQEPPRSSYSSALPPKPPLPKQPPNRMRKMSRASLSSASSLDDILEEKRRPGKLGSCLRRIKDAKLTTSEWDETTSCASSSSCAHRSSQSSGYKSEIEVSGSTVSERVWAKQRNCVMPTAIVPLAGSSNLPPKTHQFERSQSLDTESFHEITSLKPGASGGAVSSAPTGLGVIYAEPEECCRPRTNTMPKASPSRLRSRIISSPSHEVVDGKPTPTPRRSYLTAVESSKANSSKNHVYEVPFIMQKDDDNKVLSQVHYRHVPFDSNANVYRQVKAPALPPKMNRSTKSPALPPKLNKKSKPASAVDQNEEPVYAKIDKQKKISDRASKRTKGADASTKVQKAIITVCKQRMKEEQIGELQSDHQARCLHRETLSDLVYVERSDKKENRQFVMQL